MNRTSIDIVCPVISKDLDKLKVCIQSWKYIDHNIDNIFLIGDIGIKNFANENNYIFINENDYINVNLSDIRKDRQGWILQQLIKLSGNPGKCDNYLVIDADVFFIRNIQFLNENNIPIFYTQYSNWETAKNLNRKLIGEINLYPYSFVTDKMIFNNSIIKSLQNKITEYTGNDWKISIIKNYDNNSIIGFSEYELYTSFYKGKHIDLYKKIRYINWNQNYTYDEIKRKYLLWDQITFKNK